MSPLFEIDNETRANHPNIRTDAMFPPKAFHALVELIEKRAPNGTSSTGSPRRSTSRSTTSSPAFRAR